MLSIPPLKTPTPGPLARPVPRPLDIDPSCVLYMSMVDPLSTGKVLDESGKGNHGTITGATWRPDGLKFSQSTDKASIQDNASIDNNLNDFTVSAAVKLDASGLGTLQRIILKGIDPGYSLNLNTNDKLVFYLTVNSTYNMVATAISASALAAGKFYIVTGTVDRSDKIRVYINGQEDGSGGTGGITGLGLGNGNNLVIGMTGGGAQNFSGMMAEITMFNRALSAPEVKLMYDQARAWYGW